MAKVHWSEVLKRAWKMYTAREKYVYFYGAKGQILTDALMDALIKAEPAYFARYTKSEIENEIKPNSRGKIGYDCSGFVGACNDDRQYSYGQTLNGRRTKDIKAGVHGSMLFTSYKSTGRHAALDVGYGLVMDMAFESTNKNIREGKAGIRLYHNDDGTCNFEWSTESNTVDYTGAINY